MTEQIKNRIAEINQGKVPDEYKKILSSTVYKDYIETTFGELFDFYGGLGIPRDQLSDNGYPYLHYGDMHRESFTKVSVEQYNELPKYDIKLSGNETFLLEDGDVVFLDASEDLEGTSRSVMVDNPENAPFISGLHTFIAKEKHDTLAKDYKQYITMTDYVKKQFMKLASGFKVYGLNRNSIKDIVFTYPQDKQEQQKIAEILMKWDEAIALQEKLIEKLKLQKKALMQRLLNPQKNWHLKKLSEVIKVYNGYAFKSELYEDSGDYSILTIACVKNDGLVIDKNTPTINELPQDIRGHQILDVGDVLMSLTGNVGRLCKVDKPNCLLNQRVAKIAVLKTFDKDFVYQILKTYKFVEYMKMYAQGAAQDNLSVKDIYKYKICIPIDINVQKYISNILGIYDSSLEMNGEKLNKLKLQQKSLMQLLLTGIARVSE